MTISRVAVLGCGLMGSGIAEVCARAGIETTVREVDDELLEAGLGRIRKSLERAAAKGRLDESQVDEILGRVTGTTRIADLADADLVIEAIVENLEVKTGTFAELDQVVQPQAIFASNTSSLTITELAAATERTDRFIGLHFFNPVPVMKLVEIVRVLSTSDEAVTETQEFIRAIGKEPVLARDNSGFIVNRLLVPYLLDAIRALEGGVASREDIDAGMKLGCGHPMGPLALADFVGLDTTQHVAEIMFAAFKDPKYAAPPLLTRMVRAGFLGKKSGRGFYEYK